MSNEVYLDGKWWGIEPSGPYTKLPRRAFSGIPRQQPPLPDVIYLPDQSLPSDEDLGFAAPVSRNGTDGRVYGGDCELVHIKDGTRHEAGMWLADELGRYMRHNAVYYGMRTQQQADTQALCPGCYMVALVDAAVELAKQNGQPLKELAATLANAFKHVAECETYDAACIEEIKVIAGDDHVH